MKEGTKAMEGRGKKQGWRNKGSNDWTNEQRNKWINE